MASQIVCTMTHSLNYANSHRMPPSVLTRILRGAWFYYSLEDGEGLRAFSKA